MSDKDQRDEIIERLTLQQQDWERWGRSIMTSSKLTSADHQPKPYEIRQAIDCLLAAVKAPTKRVRK